MGFVQALQHLEKRDYIYNSYLSLGVRPAAGLSTATPRGFMDMRPIQITTGSIYSVIYCDVISFCILRVVVLIFILGIYSSSPTSLGSAEVRLGGNGGGASSSHAICCITALVGNPPPSNISSDSTAQYNDDGTMLSNDDDDGNEWTSVRGELGVYKLHTLCI